MSPDEQFDMFRMQAVWLEAEHHRCVTAPVVDWERFDEIQLRCAQLNREFEKFSANHQND